MKDNRPPKQSIWNSPKGDRTVNMTFESIASTVSPNSSFDIEELPPLTLNNRRVDSMGFPIPPPPSSSSLSRPSSLARVDSMGFPIPPPPPPLDSSSKIHPKTENKDTTDPTKFFGDFAEENPKSRRSRTFPLLLCLTLCVFIPVMVAIYFLAIAPRGTSEIAMEQATSSVPTQAPTDSTPNPTPLPTKSASPSALASMAPSFIESNAPSAFPTAAPSEPSETPTHFPTMTPTLTSDDPLGIQIREFLFPNNDYDAAASTSLALKRATDWLAAEANSVDTLVFPFDDKYLQRFQILKLYYTISPDDDDADYGLPNKFMYTQDECFWPGITCDANGWMTKLKLSSRKLNGTFPEEWSMFTNLVSVDLANNNLKGTIPEDFYDLFQLEQAFLYKNQLSGTISSKIENLWNLTHFHLSHNQLSGTIPPEMGSNRVRLRRLRYFSVYRNQMTGTIPPNMRMRQMFYMDLGRNQFSGTLPAELGSEYVRLRTLHLDHNQFSGNVPESYIQAGDGNIKALSLNDNGFDGALPGNHTATNRLVQLSIQNTNITSMDRSTCDLDVFRGGELVDFKSQCLVCRCSWRVCRNCVL